MRKYPFTTGSLVYAFGHFLIDLSCALIMVGTVTDPWHYIIYNFLAFAVQMPIGLLADIFGRNRTFALTGVILVLLGFLPCPVILRVITIGLGNACYHVGGGREALLKRDGLTGLGIFVSPGAVGILFGTLFAQNPLAHGLSAVSLVLCGLLILRCCSPERQILPKDKPKISLAGIMLTVVLLRSLVGMCMETPWKMGISVILGGLAAAAGKALGGALADRFGGKAVGVVSLIGAAGLFLLPDSALAGVLGVLLLNMTMPITLGSAAEGCPGFEGFAFGLLTFGLFLGYLPSAFGMTLSPLLGAALSVLSAVMLACSQEVRYA